MNISRVVMLVVTGLITAACSIGPTSAPTSAVYDLGVADVASPPARIGASLALEPVSSPRWLHSTAMMYRLAYRDVEQLHSYSLARWAAPPGEIFAQRLRRALQPAAPSGLSLASDGLRSDYLLRVELDSFVQVVDSPGAARAIIHVNVSLVDATERSLRAQRSFEAEQPCQSVDAQGAVRAFARATDTVISQIIDWTARETGAGH